MSNKQTCDACGRVLNLRDPDAVTLLSSGGQVGLCHTECVAKSQVLHPSVAKAETAGIRSSGEKDVFTTGAHRDSDKGKPRLELISPIALWRLGEWMRKGGEVHGPRNWEKGFPFDRTMASILRHCNEYREGDRVEDHPAAIMFGGMVLADHEVRIVRGLLPPELDDMPRYLPKVPSEDK